MNNSEYCKAYKLRIKMKCLALYGSACARCGFTDIRALQIDHIHSNPAEAQGAYGRGSTGLYIAILNGKKAKGDYQCLCANCNWIKRSECPDEGTHHRAS